RQDLQELPAEEEGLAMARRLATLALVALAVAPAVASAQSASTGQSATSAQSAAEAKSLNLSAYAELLRADLHAEKVAIITEVMAFTEAEDKAFWPIYREYDAEMAKLGDERVALVADYARGFDQLTDDAADKLARRALDLEARRQAVKAKYYE